jgi:ABC-2 type transport system permease protein
VYGTFLSMWIKLRRPALLLGVYGGVAAVSVLVTSLVFANTPRAATPGPRFGPSQGVAFSQLAGAGGLLTGMTSAVNLLGVLALSVAAGTMAGDHANGTLRNLLIRQPRRLRLLGGSWAALVSFAVGAVVVSAVVSGGVALAMAGREGIDTSVWFTADGWTATAKALAETAGAVAGYATLGAALGVLLRAPVASVAIGVAWLLPLETILAGTVSGSDRWLPGQLLAALARGGTSSVAVGTAGVTLAGYVVLAALASSTAFVRRDVSA